MVKLAFFIHFFVQKSRKNGFTLLPRSSLRQSAVKRESECTMTPMLSSPSNVISLLYTPLILSYRGFNREQVKIGTIA